MGETTGGGYDLNLTRLYGHSLPTLYATSFSPEKDISESTSLIFHKIVCDQSVVSLDNSSLIR